MPKYKVWECKIVIKDDVELPYGSDFSPRRAVINAVNELTGDMVLSCFSGWGGALTPIQEECVDRQVKRDQQNH